MHAEPLIDRISLFSRTDRQQEAGRLVSTSDLVGQIMDVIFSLKPYGLCVLP